MQQPMIEADPPHEEIHRDHDGEVDVDVDENDADEPGPTEPLRFKLNWRKLWRFAGPGWLMSLAYLDPGNLESDLQQGAYTGYKLVWVLFWATVMGLILQEMSARLGIVTGRDLAQTVRAGYPRWLNYVIYVNMEIAVIGSDIQEVVGTGVAIYLLSNRLIPVWVGCIITAADTLTFLAVQYFGVRYLEALVCMLISTMSICFFINWGISGGSDIQVVEGWVEPTVQSWAVTQAVGTIGAVIMPHNLYLHSGLVLSRKISRDKPHRVHEAIWYARIESAGALLMSFFINLAIVSVNADNFYNFTCASNNDADGPFACISIQAYNDSGLDKYYGMCKTDHVCSVLGLQSVGYALKHALGGYTLYFWALGLFAAGQAATMVCTYAGQIIMGGTLQIQLAPWVRVAITRVVALGPALLIAVSTYNDQALFNSINEYLNILQSIQLPFAMLPVLHFTAQEALLGRFRSGVCLSMVSSCLAFIVMSASIVLIIQFVHDHNISPGGKACFGIYFAVYFAVCARMIWTELVALPTFLLRCLRCASTKTLPSEQMTVRPLSAQPPIP